MGFYYHAESYLAGPSNCYLLSNRIVAISTENLIGKRLSINGYVYTTKSTTSGTLYLKSVEEGLNLIADENHQVTRDDVLFLTISYEDITSLTFSKTASTRTYTINSSYSNIFFKASVQNSTDALCVNTITIR